VQKGRKEKKLPLNLRWLPNFFNQETEKVLPIILHNSKKKAKTEAKEEAQQMNMELTEIKLRVQKLIIHARNSKVLITQEWFILNFSGNFITGSITDYMTKKVNYQYNEGIFSEGSKKQHYSSIKCIQRFFPELNFSSLDSNFPKRFDKKMLDSGLKRTSAWSYHNVLKKYLKLAEEDGIKFHNPYHKFRIRKGITTTKASSLEDIGKLLEYLKICTIPHHRIAIRRFLFAVFTGLRRSDITRINEIRIAHDKIKFVPYKQRKQQHELIWNLTEEAVFILEMELKENPIRPFNYYCHAYYGTLLKQVSSVLELEDERLHTHKGRRTFASFMINNKIFSIKELQAYFDHSVITTTASYLDAEETEINKKITNAKFLS
jgi:integrase